MNFDTDKNKLFKNYCKNTCFFEYYPLLILKQEYFKKEKPTQRAGLNIAYNN